MCSFSVHRGSLIKGEKTGGSEEGWSGGGVERGEGWSVVGEGWSGGVQGGVEGVRGVLTLLVTISGWRGANLGGGDKGGAVGGQVLQAPRRGSSWEKTRIGRKHGVSPGNAACMQNPLE